MEIFSSAVHPGASAGVWRFPAMAANRTRNTGLLGTAGRRGFLPESRTALDLVQTYRNSRRCFKEARMLLLPSSLPDDIAILGRHGYKRVKCLSVTVETDVRDREDGMLQAISSIGANLEELEIRWSRVSYAGFGISVLPVLTDLTLLLETFTRLDGYDDDVLSERVRQIVVGPTYHSEQYGGKPIGRLPLDVSSVSASDKRWVPGRYRVDWHKQLEGPSLGTSREIWMSPSSRVEATEDQVHIDSPRPRHAFGESDVADRPGPAFQ